ncbi:MAG TPA: hypothetical protein VF111_12635, partial [Thermoanaerobaculia bacterium]
MSRTLFLFAVAAICATTAFSQTTVETLPNTIKYKDSSIANGTGQAGDASLESRTLLNRDGSADIELTASGTITKVQVKAGNETDNFNHLENDGTASFNTTGLVRGQTVTIHANVDSPNGGTVVVQTEEIVKLRPDLTVTQIAAPAQALPNVPTLVQATVRELNGDVGARANCRLLVDGIEVDRAENIWVDAGGTVDCAFLYSFPTYGNVNITVFVDAIDPTDWDVANNSASQAIEIAGRLDRWLVEARQSDSTSFQRTTSHLWDYSTTTQDRNQVTYLLAYIEQPFNPENLSVSVSAKSEGQTIYDAPSISLGTLTREPGQNVRCTERPGTPRVIACNGHQPDDPHISNPYLYLHISSTLSDAVFHSWGYDWWINPNSPTGKPR